LIDTTLAQFRFHLDNLVGCIQFDYNGYSCGVDPIGRARYDVWYGNTDVTVTSVDDVLCTTIFNGKTLQDIWDDLTEFNY